MNVLEGLNVLDYGEFFKRLRHADTRTRRQALKDVLPMYVEMLQGYTGRDAADVQKDLLNGDISHDAWRRRNVDGTDEQAVFAHYQDDGNEWVYESMGVELTEDKLIQCVIGVEAFEKNLPYGSHILNWGGGTGCEALALIAAGFRVTIVEIAGPIVDFLVWRLQQLGIPETQWTILSMTEQEYAASLPEGFDGLFTCSALEHVPDPVRAMRNLHQKVRVGGVMALQFHFNKRKGRSKDAPIIWPEHFEYDPNDGRLLRGARFKALLTRELELEVIGDYSSWVKCLRKVR